MNPYPFRPGPGGPPGMTGPAYGVNPFPMRPYQVGHYHGYPQPAGFCHSCCHPTPQCVCGCRECRKEPKELLVAAQGERKVFGGGEKGTVLGKVSFLRMVGVVSEEEYAAKAAAVEVPNLLANMAYIGGECCVHLSIEYTLLSPQSGVAVTVVDSAGTVLAWGQLAATLLNTPQQTGYYIKEDIITTNPGAILQVEVAGGIARVRWCEVFSC